MNRMLITAGLAAVFAAQAACAQGFPASQRQTITQNVALTKLDITYGRPVARGRELWQVAV